MSKSPFPETVFEQHELGPGLQLYCYPTDKFKNTTIALFWHNNLGPDHSQLAMLPAILARGCESHPDMRSIATYMEDLYGASFDDDILKIGEHQILEYRLTLLNDQYTLESDSLLEKGLRFLSDVLTKPVMENNNFRQSVFDLERQNLIKYLHALYDDKESYAREKMIRSMFRGSPFALYEYGNEDDLKTLDASTLTDFYRNRLASSPMDLFILGEVDPEKTAALAKECFQIPRADLLPIEKNKVHQAPEQETVIFEHDQVEQGKLLMTFATPVIAGGQDHFPMVMYTGILGGFPHSKLFVNVREKKSLCYYAGSSFNPFLGHITIRSGIAAENYEATREAILHEMKRMQDGDISDEELEITKSAMLHQITVSLDSPSAMIGRAISNRLSGLSLSYQEIADRVMAVTRDQIVDAAKQLSPDTSYFLSSLPES